VNLSIFDSDGTSQLNILDYETLNELIGKTLKLTFDIRRGSGIPDKFCYKSVARYTWLDTENEFETKTVEKQKEPEYGYS